MRREEIPKSDSLKTLSKRIPRRPLSDRLKDLSRRYRSMEESGEPFGTIVVARMGQKLRDQGKDVIFCAQSIVSPRVPEFVIQETMKTFHELATKEEPPWVGLPELRQAISSRFERLYGQQVDWSREVIITSGSIQAEYYAMATILSPGDEVIIPTPSFLFDIPVTLADGKSVFVPLKAEKNYFHDANEIEQHITDKTKLMVVCNPHNPTGRVLTEEELIGIARVAIKHDLYIMHDQVYERMVYDGRPYHTMARFKDVRDRLITTSSFSKLFDMFNYRLGYAVAPAEIIRGMEIVQSFSAAGNPSMLQMGGVAALSEAFEERHLSETIAKLQLSRDYLVNKLSSVEGVKLTKPEGTNLVWVDVSAFGMKSMDICKYLLRTAGVACAPGIACHAEGFIRISLGTDRMMEAADRIADSLSNLVPGEPKKNRERLARSES